jgi:Ca-activated chloride channel family protein
MNPDNVSTSQESRDLLEIAHKTLLFLALFLCAPTGSAQPRSPFPTFTQEPSNAAPSAGIQNVLVTVLDREGNLVTSLTKDDFQIFDNGKEEKIISFSGDPLPRLPLTLGLLIDTSRSIGATMPRARLEPASEFLRRLLNKGDQAFVARFATEVQLVSDFSDDPGKLEQSILDLSKEPLSGGTALYDAVNWACTKKLAGRDGKKILVILSDGMDNLSQNSREGAIQAALRTDTAIHFLVLLDPRVNPRSTEAQMGEQAARQLSKDTGGVALQVPGEREIQVVLNLLAKILRSQYVLGYYPSNARHDGRFQKIEIKIKPPGLHVLFPKGYYGPKN